MPLVIGIFVLAGLGIGVWQFSKWRESEKFNNGVCQCGGHLKAFPKKVQECLPASSCKGYECDACQKTAWVSYGVDVDYKYFESDLSIRRKEKDGGTSSKTFGHFDVENKPSEKSR